MRPGVRAECSRRCSSGRHRLGEGVVDAGFQRDLGCSRPPTVGGLSVGASSLGAFYLVPAAHPMPQGMSSTAAGPPRITGRGLPARTPNGFHVKARLHPQRDSNPCFRLEGAMSWAAGRWGPIPRRARGDYQCASWQWHRVGWGAVVPTCQLGCHSEAHGSGGTGVPSQRKPPGGSPQGSSGVASSAASGAGGRSSASASTTSDSR